MPAETAPHAAERLELAKAMRQGIPAAVRAADTDCRILQLGPRTTRGRGDLSNGWMLKPGALTHSRGWASMVMVSKVLFFSRAR